MMTSQRPIRTTIFFGLICGLMFILIRMFFENTFLWPLFFRVTIFACLTAYSLILESWGNKRRVSGLFTRRPLRICVKRSHPHYAFLLLSLGMLSWIRSGICFQNAFAKSLGVEIIFSIGGGALVAYFNPHSTLTWALGIWMFFLIQSLYFTVMTDMGEDNVTPPVDAFEQARMKAEGILRN